MAPTSPLFWRPALASYADSALAETSLISAPKLALVAATTLAAGCGIEGVAGAVVATGAVAGWALLKYFRRAADPSVQASATGIDAYLDERSRPSLTPPAFIRPFSTISPYPVHTLTGIPHLQFEPASMTGPAPGYVRLISDRRLDRALEMVPEFIRTANPGLPPPFVYARFTDKEPAGVGHGSERPWLVHLCPIVIGRGESGSKRFLVGEIGLFDDRREDVADLKMLGPKIVVPETIIQMAENIRRFAKVNLIPPQVYDRVMEEAPRVDRLEYSTEEFDSILNARVLREVAATLWMALPPEMKARWTELLPLESTTETSVVYFRNLLRLHVEGLANDPNAKGIFARRTFADIMALYWNAEPARIHQVLHGNVTHRFLYFINDVMTWAQDHRRKYGSVFADRRTS
jgi:hypothetical protein